MTDQHQLARVEREIEPFPDPGLPEHEARPTDVDEAAEKRAERQVAGLFGLSTLFMILFIASYFTFKVGDDPSTIFGKFGASNMALGVTFGLALLCIGVGAIQWARKLMGDHEIVDPKLASGCGRGARTRRAHPAVGPRPQRHQRAVPHRLEEGHARRAGRRRRQHQARRHGDRPARQL
jgi:hypothetical protein